MASHKKHVNSSNAEGDKPDKGWMKREDHRRHTHERRRPSRKEKRREQALIDWYGQDRGQKEIAENRASFEMVGDVIKDTFASFGLEQAVLVDELQSAWETVVGKDVGHVTRPSAVKGDVLEVEVTNSAWLYVLEREHKKTLEHALQNYTENAISSIRLLPAGRNPR